MNNTDTINLSGKTIFLTGASGLLGQKFSSDYLEAGAKVALVDFNEDGLNELAQKLEASKENFIILPCDITNEAQVSETVQKAFDHFGEINVLHNNAAWKGQNIERFFDPYEEFSLDVWNEIQNVNVNGLFLVSREVGKRMVEKGIKGSIIQTGSIYGVVAPDMRIYEGSEYLGRRISSPAVYSATKAAVVGLSKYLASYWGDKGIRVNTLIPGGVYTGQNETFFEKYSARVPLKRMADIKDISHAAIFLASDMSSYISGQELIVDGGLSCW